jgi:hypothetical protein
VGDIEVIAAQEGYGDNAVTVDVEAVGVATRLGSVRRGESPARKWGMSAAVGAATSFLLIPRFDGDGLDT